MATRLTFNEAKAKFGFSSKRVSGYWVIDEFGIDISKRVKVMSMGGGLYAIDEFGIDITNRVKIEKKITKEMAESQAAYQRSHGCPTAEAVYDEDIDEWAVIVR